MALLDSSIMRALGLYTLGDQFGKRGAGSVQGKRARGSSHMRARPPRDLQFRTAYKPNPVPFSSIIQEKNNIVHK